MWRQVIADDGTARYVAQENLEELAPGQRSTTAFELKPRVSHVAA